MDTRLKGLLNAELAAADQPLIDCGDEWTELIERVDAIRTAEARLAALKEVREGIATRMYSGDVSAMSPYMVGEHNARAVEVANIDAMIAKEEGKG